METSEMPSFNAFLPGNSLAIAPEFRLLLHIAIKDVGTLGAQFSKEYERLRCIEERIEKGTFRLAEEINTWLTNCESCAGQSAGSE
jgi:hypothetical protein